MDAQAKDARPAGPTVGPKALGKRLAHGAPMAVPKGCGYDSVLFESSFAWTQACLARIVWVQLSLDPGHIGPEVRGPGTKPLGPMRGGRFGHPFGWKSALGKLQHGW